MVYIATVLDVITRTLTRVLTILVCMGYHPSLPLTYSLGITQANLADITCKLVVFAVSFFAVNLWDGFLTLRPHLTPAVSTARVYITSG